MLMILLALGCAEETAVAYSTEACQDWDLDSEDPPLLSGESTGTGLALTRNGIRQDCDASFKPDVVIERGALRVFEAWEGAGDGSCNACVMATLDVDPLPGRSYEIFWYEPEDDVNPVDTLTVDVK